MRIPRQRHPQQPETGDNLNVHQPTNGQRNEAPPHNGTSLGDTEKQSTDVGPERTARVEEAKGQGVSDSICGKRPERADPETERSRGSPGAGGLGEWGQAAWGRGFSLGLRDRSKLTVLMVV